MAWAEAQAAASAHAHALGYDVNVAVSSFSGRASVSLRRLVVVFLISSLVRRIVCRTDVDSFVVHRMRSVLKSLLRSRRPTPEPSCPFHHTRIAAKVQGLQA